MKLVYLFLILALGFMSSCKRKSSVLFAQPTGEYIYRYSDEKKLPQSSEPLISCKKESYPWEENEKGLYPKITKDFFRCKGSSLNPARFEQKGENQIRYDDCGGAQKHSLILKEDKEFIYPILIDLLNYIQNQTGKRVVITCGHCCPEHGLYIDPSNRTSKHLIGAEVDFYVQGLEFCPEKVIGLIMLYFKENAKYENLKNFQEFKRYQKEDTNVSIQPWFNDEVFIKLVKKTEGRDFDNRHLYPYISIQVRYDWDTKQKVSYSWDKAFRQFHRW